ncbi:hypothetical protein H9S87_13835 [Bacillus pumilus]|uniref:hypothetical protein n=1 Tax=Bacillus pumilus TaxID=1408 RepID=UPI001658021E|nr:hypothetical protein [Bacillus pumilus]QNP15600.1 hypothetical protein H9S87_13835 [Bacillus pumilus]
MRNKPVIQPFSERRGDQVRLSKVGGSIVTTFHGEPIFYFPTKESYEEYKVLTADAIRRKVGILA